LPIVYLCKEENQICLKSWIADDRAKSRFKNLTPFGSLSHVRRTGYPGTGIEAGPKTGTTPQEQTPASPGLVHRGPDPYRALKFVARQQHLAAQIDRERWPLGQELVHHRQCLPA